MDRGTKTRTCLRFRVGKIPGKEVERRTSRDCPLSEHTGRGVGLETEKERSQEQPSKMAAPWQSKASVRVPLETWFSNGTLGRFQTCVKEGGKGSTLKLWKHFMRRHLYMRWWHWERSKAANVQGSVDTNDEDDFLLQLCENCEHPGQRRHAGHTIDLFSIDFSTCLCAAITHRNKFKPRCVTLQLLKLLDTKGKHSDFPRTWRLHQNNTI